jgi:hypothetical protein
VRVNGPAFHPQSPQGASALFLEAPKRHVEVYPGHGGGGRPRKPLSAPPELDDMDAKRELRLGPRCLKCGRPMSLSNVEQSDEEKALVRYSFACECGETVTQEVRHH